MVQVGLAYQLLAVTAQCYDSLRKEIYDLFFIFAAVAAFLLLECNLGTRQQVYICNSHVITISGFHSWLLTNQWGSWLIAESRSRRM